MFPHSCLKDGYLLMTLLTYILDRDFAISCGDSEIVTSSGIVYERDNKIAGAASYHVSDSDKWAVSDVGSEDIKNSTYNRATDPTQNYKFENTNDSTIFQTQRLSTSSLRYYGLRLENGNYTVNLQFAETTFPDSSTWESLGRRVFNLYIQVLLFPF